MFADLERFAEFLPKSPPTELADLDERLRIFSDGRVEVWYAPLGKPVEQPRLWILGITPGWRQMRIAYESAAKALSAGVSPKRAVEAEKPQVAFAGSMRRNLVSMMDEIGLADALNVESTAELFGTDRIRTGSVLKFPVFRRGKNYAGHSPKPTTHPALIEMLDEILVRELQSVGDCMILPLGKSVERCLEYAAPAARVSRSNILAGFPHPSGANGHRIKQFSEMRPTLSKMVNRWNWNAT